MKPIYKKKEAGLNWMNLLASLIGIMLGTYSIKESVLLVKPLVLLIEICFTIFMSISFMLNYIEYKRLNKIISQLEDDEVKK